MTLHRLLGRAGGNRTRFRHDRSNPLRHDVVVVDETSMVPLSMMARLLEALRPDARLIIVGDHEQLASVEAGAVLGDIVGPAARGLCMGQAARTQLQEATRASPFPTRRRRRGPPSETGSWSCATSDVTGAPSPASPGRSRPGTRTPPWPNSRPRTPTWIGSARPVRTGDGGTTRPHPRPRGRERPPGDRSGTGGGRRDRARRPRGLPPPLRPPEGTRGRVGLDRPHRALARDRKSRDSRGGKAGTSGAH